MDQPHSQLATWEFAVIDCSEIYQPLFELAAKLRPKLEALLNGIYDGMGDETCSVEAGVAHEVRGDVCQQTLSFCKGPVVRLRMRS